MVRYWLGFDGEMELRRDVGACEFLLLTIELLVLDNHHFWMLFRRQRKPNAPLLSDRLIGDYSQE